MAFEEGLSTVFLVRSVVEASVAEGAIDPVASVFVYELFHCKNK
jgi:hypothetical protein